MSLTQEDINNCLFDEVAELQPRAHKLEADVVRLIGWLNRIAGHSSEPCPVGCSDDAALMQIWALMAIDGKELPK